MLEAKDLRRDEHSIRLQEAPEGQQNLWGFFMLHATGVIKDKSP